MLLIGKVSTAIDYHDSLVFLMAGEFEVREYIADLLSSLHTEWNHPVSMTPAAADKRKSQFVGISNQNTLRLLQRHIRFSIHYLNLPTATVKIIYAWTAHFHYGIT